jgi:hypothetical protein
VVTCERPARPVARGPSGSDPRPATGPSDRHQSRRAVEPACSPSETRAPRCSTSRLRGACRSRARPWRTSDVSGCQRPALWSQPSPPRATRWSRQGFVQSSRYGSVEQKPCHEKRGQNAPTSPGGRHLETLSAGYSRSVCRISPSRWTPEPLPAAAGYEVPYDVDMQSLAKVVALLTVFAVLTADLAAAACLLDCRVETTTHTTTSDTHPSCHAAASTEPLGTEVGPAPATCHRDHEVPSADVAPLSVRRASVAMEAVPPSLGACQLALGVRRGSSSSEPTSFRLNTTSALPLRI